MGARHLAGSSGAFRLTKVKSPIVGLRAREEGNNRKRAPNILELMRILRSCFKCGQNEEVKKKEILSRSSRGVRDSGNKAVSKKNLITKPEGKRGSEGVGGKGLTGICTKAGGGLG